MTDREEKKDPSTETTKSLQVILGATRDLSAAAIPISKMSFTTASSIASAGFKVGQKTAQTLGQTTNAVVGPNIFSVCMDVVDMIIGAARVITLTSMGGAKRITEESLTLTSRFLGAIGVDHGTLGDLVPFTEAITRIVDMICTFFDCEGAFGKYDAMMAVLALSRLQALERELRTESLTTVVRRGDGASRIIDCNMSEIQHFYRFAAASYGKPACQFLGILPYDDARTKRLEAFALLAGVNKNDVTYSSEGGGMYRPGHFVAIDRKAKAIVVAIRGTMRVQDVLTDLVCEAVPVPRGWDIPSAQDDEVPYVHEGMLKAALTLDRLISNIVCDNLERHEGYRLVVCGHSLGGGDCRVARDALGV
eukprot:g2184.t1